MENTEILQEEPIFKAKYIQTEKDETDFQKFATFRLNWAWLVFSAIAYVFILLVGSAFMRVITSSEGWVWFFVIFMLAILAVRIVNNVRRISNNIKSRLGKETVLSFYADFFVVAFMGNETSYKYDSLKVYKNGNCFYLMVNKFVGFIVKDNGFEVGTAEDFTEYLKEKLGEKFKVCKK